jgi:hypothetical protein
MFRILLIIAIFGFITNNNIISKNNSNINNLHLDIKRCNEVAFNKTKNYDLFNNINNNSNYLNEILNDNNKNDDKNEMKEIIKYKKIRLNCIKRKKENIISDIVISYMALLGLLLIIYI